MSTESAEIRRIQPDEAADNTPAAARRTGRPDVSDAGWSGGPTRLPDRPITRSRHASTHATEAVPSLDLASEPGACFLWTAWALTPIAALISAQVKPAWRARSTW